MSEPVKLLSNYLFRVEITNVIDGRICLEVEFLLSLV